MEISNETSNGLFGNPTVFPKANKTSGNQMMAMMENNELPPIVYLFILGFGNPRPCGYSFSARL